MELEIVVLSEVNQTHKDKYHMISLIYRIQKKKASDELIYKTEVENKLDYQGIWGWKG